MIGSERRVKMVLQTFQQSMEPQEWLAFPHIYAPIGLDIGALTPEEIAISICAELIKVRRGGSGRSLSERLQSTQQLPGQQPANRLPSPFTHHVPQTT
jgi:xanthine dehydrogenase accessory factor